MRQGATRTDSFPHGHAGGSVVPLPGDKRGIRGQVQGDRGVHLAAALAPGCVSRLCSRQDSSRSGSRRLGCLCVGVAPDFDHNGLHRGDYVFLNVQTNLIVGAAAEVPRQGVVGEFSCLQGKGQAVVQGSA